LELDESLCPICGRRMIHSVCVNPECVIGQNSTILVEAEAIGKETAREDGMYAIPCKDVIWEADNYD